MQRIAVPLSLIAASICAGVSLAKLPPLSDEAKAKAAETAAKTAWTEKVGAFKLCKSMEKVAADYYADAKKSNKQTKPPVATPPCTDPGPFVAAAQPESKPLEAAGAHSPPQPAATPPSTKTPHAEQGKK
jgi:hypothetical protein